MVQPTVTVDGEKAPALKFGLTPGDDVAYGADTVSAPHQRFHNRDLRALVADLLGVSSEEYTAIQMTYNLRRLLLKWLIFRPPKTHRYFLTPHGWKVARMFTRLETRVSSSWFRVHQHDAVFAVSTPGVAESCWLVPAA